MIKSANLHPKQGTAEAKGKSVSVFASPLGSMNVERTSAPDLMAMHPEIVDILIGWTQLVNRLPS